MSSPAIQSGKDHTPEFRKWLKTRAGDDFEFPQEEGWVKISGERIRRTIDLKGWNLTSLSITDSDIRGSVEGAGFHATWLCLDRTTIQGRVDLRGCSIGTVQILDSRILGSVHVGLAVDPVTGEFVPARVAQLVLNGVRTGGFVNLGGLRANGVQMILAHIGGWLSFKLGPNQERRDPGDGSAQPDLFTATSPEPEAESKRKVSAEFYEKASDICTTIAEDLDLHGITVDGFLTLRGAQVSGKVILTAAHIGGVFSCRPWRHDEREDPNVISTGMRDFQDATPDEHGSVRSIIGGGIFASRATIRGLFDISGALIKGDVDLSNAKTGGLLAQPRIYTLDGLVSSTQLSELLWFVKGGNNWRQRLKVAEICDARMWCCDLFRQQFSTSTSTITDRERKKPLKDWTDLEQRKKPILDEYTLPSREAKDYLTPRLAADASNNLASQFNHELISRRCGFGIDVANKGWPQFDPENCYPEGNSLWTHSTGNDYKKETYLKNLPDFLLKKLDYRKHVMHAQQVNPCTIFGGLNLDGAEFAGSVKIEGAFIERGISAQVAKVNGHLIVRGWVAHLSDLEAPALPLDEVRLKKRRKKANDIVVPSCIQVGSEDLNSSPYSLQGENLFVGGYLSLSGSLFESGANLVGATISGSLYADSILGCRTIIGKSVFPQSGQGGSKLVPTGTEANAGPDSEYSLCLAGAKIGSTFQIGGVYMAGGIIVENAHIGGDFLGAGQWSEKVDETDSSERRTYVGPAKWLDRETASILASNFTCEGDLDLRGSYLTNGMILNEATLKGSCSLGCRERFAPLGRRLEGYLVTYLGPAKDLSESHFSLIAVGCSIGGNLDCSGAFFQKGARLSLTSIDGHLYINAFKTTGSNYLLRTFFGEGTGSAAESHREEPMPSGAPKAGASQQTQTQVVLESSSRSSLLAIRVDVKGHIYCEGAVFISGIDISDSRIGGSLNMSPTRTQSQQMSPVETSELVETFVGMGERFRSHYMIRMPRSNVDGSVDLSGVAFRGWFSAESDGTLERSLLVLDLNQTIVRGDLTMVDDREKFALFKHSSVAEVKRACSDRGEVSPKLPKGLCDTDWAALQIRASNIGKDRSLDLRNIRCNSFALYRGSVDLYLSMLRTQRQETSNGGRTPVKIKLLHKIRSGLRQWKTKQGRAAIKKGLSDHYQMHLKQKETVKRRASNAFVFYCLFVLCIFLLPLEVGSAYIQGVPIQLASPRHWVATTTVIAFGSLVLGLLQSYRMVEISPSSSSHADGENKGRRQVSRTYQVSGMICSNYHFGNTSELSILEPRAHEKEGLTEDEKGAAQKQDRKNQKSDVKILEKVIRVQRPAGHGSEFPSLLGYAWLSCFFFWSTAVVAVIAVHPWQTVHARFAWTVVLVTASTLTGITMVLFPAIRRSVESYESSKREYGSILRAYFLGRCEPSEDVYRSIESMLINQGRLREADKVCQSWQSRNIWSDPLGSIFDMVVHLFIRHGLRVREILMIYAGIFLFGIAVFSNPGNVTYPQGVRPPFGPSLSQGVEMTLLTAFPFADSSGTVITEPGQQPGEKKKEAKDPSATVVNNNVQKPNESKGVDNTPQGNELGQRTSALPTPRIDQPAIISLSREPVATWMLWIKPVEVRMWMRIIGVLLIPFLLPSFQRAIPRLRDRRAH